MNTELKEKLEENVTCSICLERYKWPLTLSPCVHSYCKICLENYTDKFSSKPSSGEITFRCPDCRTLITLPHTGIDGLTHNHKLQSIVDSLELHERRKQTELETLENEGKLKKTVQDEEVVANSSSPSTDNKDDKASDNNNNGRSQQIPTEEKVVETSTNGGVNTSFSPPDAKEVCKPPRPPPPNVSKQSTTMLYPDIATEKANLQMELEAEEQAIDLDPCKDNLLIKFGKYGSGVNDFRKPYGLAVSTRGDVFISDQTGSRILHFSEEGKFLSKIVTDCDIHDINLFLNGSLLVATSKAQNTILRIYSLHGAILGEYSGLHFNYAKPSGVAIGVGNYAVVTSLENNCVYVFTEQQRLSKSFGWKGAGNEHFNSPAFVAINHKNYIIVSDMGNHCLKVFTMEGKFKYCFGQKGKNIGMLMNPMGVCTDYDNNVIVADAGNFRVQAFSPKGRPLGCPLQDTFRIGPNVRPINVSMDHHNNIVVLLLGTQFAEVRTYLWTPPPPDSLQDSFIKFTSSSISKMFENIAGNF